MRHGLGQNEIYPSLSTVPESQTRTSWTAEKCVEYISRRRDPAVPFFLWCSFSKPHPPLDPPEPYYSMYRDSPIPEPVIGTWRDDETCPAVFRREQVIWGAGRIDPEVIRAARAAYFGLITQIDYHIGRLFAALHETGTSDETMILFASDHGEFLGDHRAVSKTYFHEAAAHVPLVLRLPQAWDDRHHGDTCDALVGLSGILPTCVAAAGAEPPVDIDGIDLAAVARGQREPRDYVEATVARRDGPHASRGLMRQWGTYYRAITDGRWKYIWYPEGGCEQLFDLESDPHECSNVRDQHPDHAGRLRSELERRHGTLEPVAEIEIDERDLRNFYRLSCMTEEMEQDIRH